MATRGQRRFWLVAYDVSCDRRRTRLFEGLKSWLAPVQRSVFEGLVPDDRVASMRGFIERTIDHDEDSVRVHVLCDGCRGRSVWYGVQRGTASGVGPLVIG